MILKYSFKEDDRRYNRFVLNKEELELISKYFNQTFTPDTMLYCIYNYDFYLIAVQIVGNKVYELQPEEAIKLFKNKIKEREVPYAEC